MKKLSVITAILALSLSSWGQQSELTKADFLRKSNNQNKIAWVLLGGGFAAATTGIIIGSRQVEQQIDNLFTGEPQKNSGGGGWFIAGCTMMISSIPFFVSSSHNKQKAATAFFKMETQPLVQQGSFMKASYPAIAFKINL